MMKRTFRQSKDVAGLESEVKDKLKKRSRRLNSMDGMLASRGELKAEPDRVNVETLRSIVEP
ncbi:MAG: hypothetical protein GF409_07655 [Candidatus Omnitrophica bacterium]|nr:hypothetical protein [Candidatus Omnitrophota bacterium]